MVSLQCLSTMLWLTYRPRWQWQCTTYRSNSDWYVVQILCRPRWFSGWSVGVALRVIFWCSPHTASPLWNKTVIFWWSWTASQRGMKNILDQLPPFFHPWTTLPSRDNRFHLSHCHPKTSPGSQNRPCHPKNGPTTPQCALQLFWVSRCLNWLELVMAPHIQNNCRCSGLYNIALCIPSWVSGPPPLWTWNDPGKVSAGSRRFDNDQDLWQWPRSWR